MSFEKIRPEGGERKRPAATSGGRLSGPSESRQERDLATGVPASGLPVPVPFRMLGSEDLDAIATESARAAGVLDAEFSAPRGGISFASGACGRCGHVHPRSDLSVLTCECGCLAEGATDGG